MCNGHGSVYLSSLAEIRWQELSLLEFILFFLRNLNASIYYVAYILLAHVWGKLSEFFFSMNRGSIIHRKYFYGSASLLPLTTAFSVSIKLWHIIFFGIYSGSTNCGVDRVYSLCYFFNLKKAIFSEFLHFFLLLGLTFT